MSDIHNINFEANDGILFDVYIDDKDIRFYLDITIFEDLVSKKCITNRGVALTLFHSIRARVYQACLVAYSENKNWRNESPLPLLRKNFQAK